jgi:hypothetical protein
MNIRPVGTELLHAEREETDGPATDVTKLLVFLISNVRRVLNVVCFLLGNSPASEFYMPTFRNTLSVIYKRVTLSLSVPSAYAYEDGRECYETSAYKIQTPENYPEESIQLS